MHPQAAIGEGIALPPANARRPTSGALGPDSSIADYLPYIHSGTYGDRALAGIQKARIRRRPRRHGAARKNAARRAGRSSRSSNVAPDTRALHGLWQRPEPLANRIAETRGTISRPRSISNGSMPNLKWLKRPKAI